MENQEISMKEMEKIMNILYTIIGERYGYEIEVELVPKETTEREF